MSFFSLPVGTTAQGGRLFHFQSLQINVRFVAIFHSQEKLDIWGGGEGDTKVRYEMRTSTMMEAITRGKSRTAGDTIANGNIVRHYTYWKINGNALGGDVKVFQLVLFRPKLKSSFVVVVCTEL